MKMGRDNRIGTNREDGKMEKVFSVGALLLGNENNNNNIKGLKVQSQARQHGERIIQSSLGVHVSTNNKTKKLESRNGKPPMVNKAKLSTVGISSRACNQVTVAQSHQDNGPETRKDVFQFWSRVSRANLNNETCVNANSRTSQDVGSSESKSNVVSQNVSGKKGIKCDFSEDSIIIESAPRKRREEMFSSNSFTHLDDHVIALSRQMKTENCSIQELVHKITEQTQNVLEKLRAIWLWLCYNIKYDVEGFLGLSEKIYKPEDVLATGKAVCSGYAGLCKDMCSEIGIPCREVAGYSRGTEYNDGRSFHRTKSNHMWNAVKLESQWHLLDACWGAGTVDLQNRIFIPSYDDFFFLTDPEDFIETHWPDDPAWQLLETKVPFKEFEQKIFKTSEFFRLHLFTVSPKVYYLKTDHGEVKLSLGCSQPMEFSYKIYKLFDNDRSLVEKTHGILTMQESGMSLRVIPPMDGLYELMIFARSTGSKDTYKWVCSYQIECLEPKCAQELPENPFHFWGLHPSGRDFGVTGYNFGEDLIVAEAGALYLKFQTSRPLLAMYELAHKQLTGSFGKKCYSSHIEEQQLGCHLLLPYHGFYRLSVFVKELDGENFKNAANLLIHCSSPINHNELFPLNLTNHCGPGINSKLNGLTDPSHVSPIINTTTGKCNITFHTVSDIEVYAVLEKDTVKSNVYSLERYCLITHIDHKVSISVLLPETGYYKLSIFTTCQDGQAFRHVCDYVIRCHSDNHVLPFPKLYTAWRHSYTLLQPRSGLLAEETWVDFRIKIPGAYKVVVIGPSKTELQIANKKIWEGKVFTGPAGCLIKLAVKFTQNSTTMDIVMAFKVQTNLNIIDNSSG